jgi:hypothetical protein
MVTKFASDPKLDRAVRLRVHEFLAEQARPIRRILDELLEPHRVHAALRQVVVHEVLPGGLHPFHGE